MIGATLYIAGCTARNRLRVRLRRLRQPRYLVGAIAGIAYVYLVIFARRRPRSAVARGRSARADAAMAAVVAAAPPVAGTVLLAGAAAAWVVPFDSGLLEFSDAEVDFLFTAPVTRRQLLVHRLMRSQLGLLFAAIVPVVFYPGLSTLARLRSAVALWIAFVTIRVYFTGVTLARRGAESASGEVRRTRLLFPGVLFGGAALAVIATIARRFIAHPAADIRDAAALIAQVVSAGWPHAIVAPFEALARPLFASDLAGFLSSLVVTMLICAAVCAWVVRMEDAAFVTDPAPRSGEAQPKRTVPPVLRRAPWTLAAAGRPEPALAWRAAAEMLRSAGVVSALRPLAAFASFVLVAVVASHQRGVAQLLFVLSAVAAAMAIVLGPQMLRFDLRQDLRNIDLLKTWPLRPADVIRGEMLWPAVVLTGGAWIALTFVFVTSHGLSLSLVTRISALVAVAIVTPALIAAQLAIHNAAALAFPAWVATGGQRPRGLDAMGQRLILLGATLLLLVVMFLPGAAAGAAIWFGLRRLAGPPILIASALVCFTVVMIEVLVATEAMAPLYERLDLSEIERSET